MRPDGASWGPVIDDILATGRCHWVSPQSQAFRLADARNAELGWEDSEGGDPLPVLKMDPPCAFFLGTSPLRFVDPNSGEMGAVELGEAPAGLAHAWISAPPISASEATEIAMLLRSHPELRTAVPALETRAIETRRGVTPTPILRLNKVNASARRRPAASAQALLGINVADLQFEYLGRRIPASDPSSHVQVIRGGGRRVLQVERDRAVENDRLAELLGCGFRRLDDQFAEGHIADPVPGDARFRIRGKRRSQSDAAGGVDRLCHRRCRGSESGRVDGGDRARVRISGRRAGGVVWRGDRAGTWKLGRGSTGSNFRSGWKWAVAG